MNLPDDAGCGYYRARLPVLQCYSELAKEGIELVCHNNLTSDELHFDAYIFHRMLNDAGMTFLRKARDELHRKLVISYDDSIADVEPWMPNYEHCQDKGRLRLVNDWVSRIDCSTETLKNRIGELQKSIVLPNLADECSYAQQKEKLGGPLRIMWAGSAFHEKNLDIVSEAIKQLAEEYRNKVRFIYYGYLPDGFATYYRAQAGTAIGKQAVHPDYDYAISFFTPTHFKYYFHQLNSIQADIAFAPLMNTQFNSCRSNLKYLEYTLAGAAFIGSDLAPYKCVKHNQTGLLTGEAGWYDAIKRLIDDEELRKHLHTNAVADVRENYTWNNGQKRKLWIEAFRSLVS